MRRRWHNTDIHGGDRLRVVRSRWRWRGCSRGATRFFDEVLGSNVLDAPEGQSRSGVWSMGGGGGGGCVGRWRLVTAGGVHVGSRHCPAPAGPNLRGDRGGAGRRWGGELFEYGGGTGVRPDRRMGWVIKCRPSDPCRSSTRSQKDSGALTGTAAARARTVRACANHRAAQRLRGDSR